MNEYKIDSNTFPCGHSSDYVWFYFKSHDERDHQYPIWGDTIVRHRCLTPLTDGLPALNKPIVSRKETLLDAPEKTGLLPTGTILGTWYKIFPFSNPFFPTASNTYISNLRFQDTCLILYLVGILLEFVSAGLSEKLFPFLRLCLFPTILHSSGLYINVCTVR